MTDEGRGWCSDNFAEWCGNHSVEHLVAPGEAHNRLGVVERRHAVLRKAVEIYMTDLNLDDIDGLRQALTYVIPQANAQPTVAGFSPTQWVLGFQPNAPGQLSAEGLNPTHVDGSDNFAKVLHRRAAAKSALAQADIDRKLQRALLRKYEGTNQPLEPGQLCYYWRDARAGDLVKIRWLGPARVVMREAKEDGTPTLYWLARNTQLIRCAPHHVRPDFRAAETSIGDIREAMKEVTKLKSGGVTRYLDLRAANKRHIDDVDTDEEADGEIDDPNMAPSLTTRRFNRRRLGEIEMSEEDERYTPSIAPTSDMDTGEPTQRDGEVVTVDPTPTTTPEEVEVDLGEIFTPEELAMPTIPEHAPIEVDEEEPAQEPAAPASAAPTSPAPSGDPDPEVQELLQLYEPAQAENFESRRSRLERQETFSFGPSRRSRHGTMSSSSTSGPYTAILHGIRRRLRTS